jgi:hypothetical protein
MKFVTVSLWQMATAWLATPIGQISALLMIAGGALLKFYQASKKAREELESYQEAAKATVAALDTQIAAMKTMADLKTAEATATQKLTEAILEYNAARDAGDPAKMQAAAEKEIALRKQLEKIQKTGKGNLELDQAGLEAEARLRAGRKEADAMRKESSSGSGAGADAQRATEAYVEQRRKAAAARAATAADEAMEAEKLRITRAQRPVNDQIAGLSVRKTELQGRLRDAEAAAMGAGAQQGATGGQEALNRKVAAYREEIAGVESEMEGLLATQKKLEEAATRAAYELGSELTTINQQLADAKALGLDARQVQDLQSRKTEIEAERANAVDPAKEQALLEAMITAQLAAANEAEDAAGRVFALRFKGLAVEERLLEIEYAKVAAAEKAGRLKGQDREAAIRELNARSEALAKEAALRRGELSEAMRISALRRQEQQAREDGDTKGAAAKRAEADALDDQATRREAMAAAEKATVDQAEQQRFADAAVREAQAARAAERERQEQEQALSRKESTVKQRGAVGTLQEQLERMKGNSREAAAMRERQAREKDEVDRERARRGYIDQGFDQGTAKRMADTDVKTAQADRMIEQLTGTRSSVVASSLAQIGGGGGAYGGQDKQTQLMEKMVKVMEEVRDTTKENIGMGGML